MEHWSIQLEYSFVQLRGRNIHLQSLQQKNLSNLKTHDNKCIDCNEIITPLTIKHKRLCKVYSKCYERTSERYDCKLCSFEIIVVENQAKGKTKRSRLRMYRHLKTRHKIGKVASSKEILDEEMTAIEKTISNAKSSWEKWLKTGVDSSPQCRIKLKHFFQPNGC